MAPGNDSKPAIDAKDRPLTQIGLVVEDAVKVTKRYSEIFGIGPWVFFDGKPRDFVLHGETLRDMDCGLRVAIGYLGKMQLEIIQPLYGPSTHMSFLKEQGEGIHHVSFGVVEDHDQVVSDLQASGIDIEMQGLSGDTGTFTYMATQDKLGTIYEFVNPAMSRGQGPGFWGRYDAPGAGAVDIEGKEIKQLGIVVADAEEAAKNYWDLFGVGPWVLLDIGAPHVADRIFQGIPLNDDADVRTKAAIAQLGTMQLELLQPVQGPSTHMDFARTKGQGIHHVSFDRVEDHDEVVAGFQSLGIGIESSGLLGGSIVFTYMASQDDIGTIFEATKTVPGKESSLTPYGTYPPRG